MDRSLPRGHDPGGVTVPGAGRWVSCRSGSSSASGLRRTSGSRPVHTPRTPVSATRGPPRLSLFVIFSPHRCPFLLQTAAVAGGAPVVLYAFVLLPFRGGIVLISARRRKTFYETQWWVTKVVSRCTCEEVFSKAGLLKTRGSPKSLWPANMKDLTADQ